MKYKIVRNALGQYAAKVIDISTLYYGDINENGLLKHKGFFQDHYKCWYNSKMQAEKNADKYFKKIDKILTKKNLWNEYKVKRDTIID